ncbi:MAG: AraC family transcriptional regulator [Paracoccaceae bacterium]
MEDAYCFHKHFEPSDPMEFQTEQHYFLYSLKGTLRLEALGKRWTLPPARAALIRAGRTIQISVLSNATTASVLFPCDVIDTPQDVLSVFDMTPLARELVTECRNWGQDAHPLTPYAQGIFKTLGNVISRLAQTPSRCVLPAPTSPGLAKAVTLTEERFDQALTFEVIADLCGQSPRALARRFANEMGMTWTQTLARIRIIQAIERLAMSESSVTDIALSVGYNSLSGFNAAFRDLTDMTPTQYRASFSI